MKHFKVLNNNVKTHVAWQKPKQNLNQKQKQKKDKKIVT
jgi:hypothetical protein